MSGPTPTPPLKGRASIGTLLASPAWRASIGTLLASPLGGRVLGGYSPTRLGGRVSGRYSPPRLAGESWAITRLPAWRASPGRLLASPLGGEVLGAYSPPRLTGRVGRGSDCNPGADGFSFLRAPSGPSRTAGRRGQGPGSSTRSSAAVVRCTPRACGISWSRSLPASACTCARP